MQVNYQYASPSMCIHKGDHTVLGLSPDLSRSEKVSFVGKLKNPLLFRDAMLMLRQIVISDMSSQKKERVEFFAWLENEIERRIFLHNQYLPGVREDMQNKIKSLEVDVVNKDKEIIELINLKKELAKQIESHDIWRDYYKIERDFWKFIKDRDNALWWVLDPVITVHPDQVSFEAFSLDESTYGCLSVDMAEFDIVEEPRLGTTNIDFSAKLVKEMERFRTYTNVELSINPGGFTVDTGIMPEYLEKKIDLPETWIKGFNQVSSASSLGGIDITLTPVDMYDICSFLRRNKEKSSPRYMKWLLEPDKNIQILFEPFGKILELSAVYRGKKREEKIWGRRRWLIIEKIIPLAKSFNIKLMGFGMPQFIIANLGTMKMTIGFTSWSANDWVKGTAFNILGGFIGNGNYEEIYQLLKEQRFLTIDMINKKFSNFSKNQNKAGIGMLLRKGEGYFDPIINSIRFRQLCNTQIPKKLYETTPTEIKVQEHLAEGMDNFIIKQTANKEFIAINAYQKPNPKYKKWKYYRTDDFNREFDKTQTEIIIDQDGQIARVKCDCNEFNRGPRNISAPCSHILALYVSTSKFLHLELVQDIDYKMNDILEMLL